MNSFHSPWMDWKSKKEGGSAVSAVSSLDKRKDKNFSGEKSAVSSVSASDKDLSEKKKDLKMLFYRTDTTDSTLCILDGHAVARIIWETEKAVVFADDLGRVWRFLHAYGKAWPFVVS
jgi:hypothetical protein